MFSDVKTPLVPKEILEKKDVAAVNIKFIPIEAINVFALVFDKKSAKTNTLKVDVIIEMVIPRMTEPVMWIKKNVKYEENEINPSKNNAKDPAYSLKRAPQAASKRGQE